MTMAPSTPAFAAMVIKGAFKEFLII
uniref:HSP60-2 (HEAT SHOCK PROTEIN 60-2) n=1 Tax=Arundo donax TaxID=35708 RepID=A0A0A9EI48_ARUDO